MKQLRDFYFQHIIPFVKRLLTITFCLGMSALHAESITDTSPACESIYRPNYDCIASDGTFQRVLKIETIDCNTLAYPFLFTFSPVNAYETLLGPGWEIPIFDARIFQQSDNEFVVSLPNGSKIILLRSRNDQRLLTHPSGWHGEIERESVKIKSPKGFSYIYKKGKISTIETPSGETFLINRSARLYQLILARNQRVIVSIAPSKANDNSFVATIGDKVITLTTIKRPLIRTAQGQNHINAMVLALKEVSIEERRLLTVNYDVTPDLLPRVQFLDSTQNPFVDAQWNPNTGALIKENGWEYVFNKPSIDSSYKITRKNTRGLTEGFTYDPTHAISRRDDTLGGTTILSGYPSTLKIDIPRKISVIRNGKEELFFRSSIDDKGRILRETTQSSNGPIETSYNYTLKDGDFEKFVTQDACVMKETYKEGVLVSTTVGKWNISRNIKGEVSISPERQKPISNNLK